ncbi:dihydrofolate reductase family protein [Isoalcanivorax indicus]|uniref:dihydrofolate reductase family protein n=1 Tax=Isoalcanivorax indicus TaxID=2202653 RepID=UPI000DB9E0FC|nr:dihydrofolate reductase family protein [Isoalcanivorax indicus]
MAHVIHSINATLSGRCHHLDSLIDDTHHQYAIDLVTAADALILGARTFALFEAFWPAAANRQDLPEHTVALARAFTQTRKYVVSARPVETSWENTVHVPGPGLTNLAKTLSEVPGVAVLFGSPGLAAAMMNDGLIHDVHLLAQPLIGVEGPQAYTGLSQRVDLTLAEARPFPSGVVLLRYKVG